MSIPRSGTFTRSAGLISAIATQLKAFTLKPVRRIVTEYDPFHEKVKETRNFLFHISGPKVIATNPSCIVKTKIVCDRSEPKITFNLESGENVVMKSTNLSALNILELYNKHISCLAPPAQAEEEVEEPKKKKKASKKHRVKPGSKRRGVFL